MEINLGDWKNIHVFLKADLNSNTVSVTISRNILDVVYSVFFLASCAIAIDLKNCKYQHTNK